ncbi:MAG: hypothetical protein V1824_04340 [archaeon]
MKLKYGINSKLRKTFVIIYFIFLIITLALFFFISILSYFEISKSGEKRPESLFSALSSIGTLGMSILTIYMIYQNNLMIQKENKLRKNQIISLLHSYLNKIGVNNKITISSSDFDYIKKEVIMNKYLLKTLMREAVDKIFVEENGIGISEKYYYLSKDNKYMKQLISLVKKEYEAIRN